MARRTVQANGREYLFSPDDQPPLSSRWWGLVRARLINDVTEEPIRGGIRIESDLVMTLPRITSDGLVGLVAIPAVVFPMLAGRNYTVNLTIHATGYVSQTVSVVIPNDARITQGPLPLAGDRILTLNDTARLGVGETLMVGNPVTNPGSRFEQIRIAALGPAPNQVTIRPELRMDHVVLEPVFPVVPTDFGPTDVSPDVRMVPQA